MKKIVFLSMIFISILLANLRLSAQPGTNKEEFNRRRHWVGGTYGHPYTMFDRHNGKTFTQTIQNIRFKIKQEYDSVNLNHGPVFKAYQLVYNHAMLPRPTDNGMPWDKVSDLALWAKNNAFVMLVGLDGNGNALSLHERRLCKDKVIDAFNNMKMEIPNKDGKYYFYFAGLGLAAVHPVAGIGLASIALIKQVEEETRVKKRFQFYSRSHILWLQAYDLLKASAALPELDNIKYFNNGNSDANIGRQSPRNKLRSQTRNLYKMSKGVLGIVTHRFGWKLNHGISCASALLLSAQVLNDAGVETNILQGNFLFRLFNGMGYNPDYSPEKWHEFAREGLQENLFVGNHWPILANDNPAAPLKTGKGEFSPYAEGPVYADYGLLDCGIPAMRAEQNFFPDGSNEPLLKKNEINNIFNWLNAIKIGNSGLPTFDNSRSGASCWELALSNNKDMNYGYIDAIKANTADYIALIGGNNISLSTEQLDPMDNKLAETGNIVLRNKTEKGEYYFQMLAEHGIAVDLPSGIFEGGDMKNQI